MDDAAADAATQADAARAFAVVRAAFVRDGGVAAATAVLRVAARLAFVEEDGAGLSGVPGGKAEFQGDETAPARTRARVAEVLERAAGLLARAREGGRDAATEFRVEGGYAAAAEALCHACVSPRAEADLGDGAGGDLPRRRARGAARSRRGASWRSASGSGTSPRASRGTPARLRGCAGTATRATARRRCASRSPR